jgi:hypothetical protein
LNQEAEIDERLFERFPRGNSTMIRIMTATEPKAFTITVDGRLVGEYIEALETSVEQAIGHGRPVHLVLRDVTSIDESGRALLGRLAAKGVQLSAGGVYTSYIVANISASAAQAKARQ